MEDKIKKYIQEQIDHNETQIEVYKGNAYKGVHLDYIRGKLAVLNTLMRKFAQG